MRGVFFDALAAMPFFSGFTCRKQKQLQVQSQIIPYLGVYFVEEPHTPDGDLNHGEIKFIHSVRIGISVIIANNDPDASEAILDQAYQAIMTRLWTDEYIMNMIDTFNYGTGVQNNPDNTRSEGVERIRRRHVFGNPSLNNELPTAELQLEITIRMRTRWPAVVPDDFEHMHVEVRPVMQYPPADDLNDSTMPVVAEYDIQMMTETPDYSVPPERGTSSDQPP
jgi:hypothetical protein